LRATLARRPRAAMLRGSLVLRFRLAVAGRYYAFAAFF
jgi:hypothetical protein